MWVFGLFDEKLFISLDIIDVVLCLVVEIVGLFVIVVSIECFD